MSQVPGRKTSHQWAENLNVKAVKRFRSCEGQRTIIIKYFSGDLGPRVLKDSWGSRPVASELFQALWKRHKAKARIWPKKWICLHLITSLRAGRTVYSWSRGCLTWKSLYIVTSVKYLIRVTFPCSIMSFQVLVECLLILAWHLPTDSVESAMNSHLRAYCKSSWELNLITYVPSWLSGYC